MKKVLCLLVAGLFCSITAVAQNPLDFGLLIDGKPIRTADPSAHVWPDGRLYVYTSHDEECQADFHMKDWHVFSTDDLINWQAHGAVMSVDDLSWADDYAWAPDAAYKNGKYYLVFPAGTGSKDRANPANSTKWMGIGIDFDYYVAEMADDLRSIKGGFQKMDMGGYEPKMEGPWVFKRNNLYYFTMPEGNRVLTYYTAQSPIGPWTYQGVIMEQEHQSNNHHSIVEFEGNWLLFYHRWLDTPESNCNKKQRHTADEPIYFNADGSIVPVVRTKQGLRLISDKNRTNIR